MRTLLLCLILIFLANAVHAQSGKGGRSSARKPAQEADAYRFAPPPPPPLDPPEYDEIEDEEFDEGFRPPPIPPTPGGQGQPMQAAPPPPPQPPPDFRASNKAYMSGPGKFRFQVVDGEYYKKGSKRSRGRKVIGQSGGN